MNSERVDCNNDIGDSSVQAGTTSRTFWSTNHKKVNPPTVQEVRTENFNMNSLWAILMALLFVWAEPGGAATEEAMEIYAHCSSWRLSVETNNLRNWKAVPEECVPYIEQYMLEGQYEKDLAAAIAHAVVYAKEFNLAGDGMDAWVLDVDDTSLSNLEYYRSRKFGGELFDPVAFGAWALSGMCPALPATLDLYKQLIAAGFKVFFITGRDESQRKVTEENLISQGYTEWAGLILRYPLVLVLLLFCAFMAGLGSEKLGFSEKLGLVDFRGPSDRGTSAVVFKSRKREELTKEGYRIWGNGGDQWSDITGDAVGARTFKLPNPMYFIP